MTNLTTSFNQSRSLPQIYTNFHQSALSLPSPMNPEWVLQSCSIKLGRVVYSVETTRILHYLCGNIQYGNGCQICISQRSFSKGAKKLWLNFILGLLSPAACSDGMAELHDEIKFSLPICDDMATPNLESHILNGMV